MSTKTATYTAKGFLGRTEEGARVWVEIEISDVDRAAQTTEHETVNGYQELSISGAVADKGYAVAHSWGQVRADAVGAMTKPAKGLTEDDIAHLVTVWKRWHLNGVQAGCAHQGRGMDTPPCPETGYRYGSAWLVTPLPADVIEWIREFGAKLDGTQARG